MARESVKRARGRSEERKDRTMEDRSITANRQLTDDERVAMFRKSNFQSALPDLPKIPGYHNFWATTLNGKDTIHQRQMLGYEFIKAEEVPGFESLSLKTGDYPGCIGVNEMIAMKLPNFLYDAYMRENHFDRPLQEEETIYNSMMQAGETAAQSARRGGSMKAPVIEEGSSQLGQAREVPSFADEDDGE